MSRTISLREANQGFARYIRDVEAGEDFVITRNGRPVACLVPVSDAPLSPRRAAALVRSQSRMAEGWHLGAASLDRAALHER